MKDARKVIADLICLLIEFFNRTYGEYEEFTYMRHYYGEPKVNKN